jgi:hypothetical protein
MARGGCHRVAAVACTASMYANGRRPADGARLAKTCRMRMILAAVLCLAVPTTTLADPGRNDRTGTVGKVAAVEIASKEAKLIPTMRDDVFVGYKVYAIKPGGRFDAAAFTAGDLIEQVDGTDVTVKAGNLLLREHVVNGTTDATVTVRRQGSLVNLTVRHAP